MTDSTNPAAHPERLAFPRLLLRSAILGFLVPVTQGDFWEQKTAQVVFALVICLVLYGLEKALLYPFRNRLTIKSQYAAGYRGGLLYGLMILISSGDWARALGAGLGGALAAMLLFLLENGIMRVIYRTPSANVPLEGGPR